MDEDSVVCCKSHIGDIVLIFSDYHAVGTDAFTPLWCALAFYKARVGVLGSGINVFSLDGLNDVLYGDILEGVFDPRGLNQVILPDVAWGEAPDKF